jgi:transposase-like protein
LIISDACIGLVESATEYFPGARWQRCMVHFYRNVFSHVPAGKLHEVALTLKAIHAQEDLAAAFPDGNSAINLAAARLRHIAGSRWSTKRYLNMKLLRQHNAITA